MIVMFSVMGLCLKFFVIVGSVVMMMFVLMFFMNNV